VWRFDSFIDNLASDVRLAVRGLVHKPAYAIAVILTLALGIGANAVVFALVCATEFHMDRESCTPGDRLRCGYIRQRAEHRTTGSTTAW
jgi:hypothetical protein